MPDDARAPDAPSDEPVANQRPSPPPHEAGYEKVERRAPMAQDEDGNDVGDGSERTPGSPVTRVDKPDRRNLQVWRALSLQNPGYPPSRSSLNLGPAVELAPMGFLLGQKPELSGERHSHILGGRAGRDTIDEGHYHMRRKVNPAGAVACKNGKEA